MIVLSFNMYSMPAEPDCTSGLELKTTRVRLLKLLIIGKQDRVAPDKLSRALRRSADFRYSTSALVGAGEGNGTPLQYSCLENPMNGGAWWAAVHGVMKSQTGLSDFTFTFHFRALEKEMATHSSVVAWKIPGTGEPGRLPSMGSHRVGHD